MIVKNAPPYDIRFMLHVAPSSLPTDSIATWVLRYTWGQGYDHNPITPALWHGWKLTVTQWAVTSGGTPAHYKIEFESPWDGTNFVETGSGLHDWYFNVYMRAADLIGLCDAAVLHFDELELTRSDTENGSETSLYTIGSQTYTNTSYDARLNEAFVQPSISAVFASPGAASCPSTFGGAVPANVDAIAGGQYAWLFSKPGLDEWREESVEFDNVDELYGSCLCDAAVGDVVYDSPPFNSRWMTLTASIADHYSKVLVLTQTLTCPGSSTPIIIKWNDIVRHLETHSIGIDVHRRGGIMRGRVIDTVEICDENGTTGTTTTSVTTTDEHTICLKQTLDFEGTWHTLCDYRITSPPFDPCVPPFEYEPDVPDPDPADYPYCTKSIAIGQTWVEPDCNDGRHLSMDVDHGSGVFRLAQAKGEATIIASADAQLSWEDEEAGMASNWVSLACDKSNHKQVWYLAVEYNGESSLWKSVDLCRTFTQVGSSFVAEKPIVIIGRQNVRHLYWVDGTDIKGELRDASDTVIESTFTATTGVDPDDGCTVDEYVVEGGQKKLHMVCVKSGVRTHLDSTDGKTFV